MALDISSLLTSMLTAAQNSAKTNWKIVEPFAKTQCTNIAQQIVDIEAQLATGSIDTETASLLLDMQKNASRAALLTVEGIGLLTAQTAINAALGAVSIAVNKAVGFALVP